MRFFNEVSDEHPIPGEVSLVHVDEQLVVADKPHFLPVTTAGRFVREKLPPPEVMRVCNQGLVPLHRIDRGMARDTLPLQLLARSLHIKDRLTREMHYFESSLNLV